MEAKTKKRHPLRTILLIILAIIILALLSPFIYDLIGGFSDYDDIPALIASDGGRALSIDSDGVVSFSANKAAVYSYAAGEEFDRKILERIQELPFCSENTVSFRKFGYDLSSDSLAISAKLKLFGFLPVQLHADADMDISPEELTIKLNSLKYGRWISIPLEKYAESYDIPELTEGYTIDTSDFYGELYPIELTSGDNVISFRCNILNETKKNVGASGAAMAQAMPYICGEDTDAAEFLRGETAEVCSKVKDSAALSELITGMLRFGTEENAATFKESLEDTPFLSLKIGDVSGYSSALFEQLKEYETSLTALRDNYKEMNYHLAKNGPRDSDDVPAEAALPEDWGARIVFQYNQDFNSIVKANDGKLSIGLGAWIILPNPKFTDLKRDKNVVLPKIAGVKVFDLTVAMRLTDGSPAIVFLTAIDELGINVISEDLYEEITSNENIPFYCSEDIISPAQIHLDSPGKEQRNLQMYLP